MAAGYRAGARDRGACVLRGQKQLGPQPRAREPRLIAMAQCFAGCWYGNATDDRAASMIPRTPTSACPCHIFKLERTEPTRARALPLRVAWNRRALLQR